MSSETKYINIIITQQSICSQLLTKSNSEFLHSFSHQMNKNQRLAVLEL